MKADGVRKHLDWMGSSKADLKGLPFEAKEVLTYGILLAEFGDRHPDARHLTGIDAEEIVCDHDGNTFRAVYAVLDDRLYVLHCFQKKSKKGKKTPKPDIERIRERLKDAKALHKKEGRARKGADRPRGKQR
jgi:phage-related protein